LAQFHLVHERDGRVRYIPDVLDVSADASGISLRGQYDPDRLPPFLAPRTANWSEIQSGRLLDTARKSVVVYACLTYLADAVAESPLRVYRRTTDDVTEIPDHRARQVIANPNPFMSEAEFIALLVMAMGMQGYAVVEKSRSYAGLPVQLWPLRPDWLSRRLSANGSRLQEWDYRVPGDDPRIIPASDLIVIPYRHDERQDRPGVSPLQIAAREVGIDSALTDFLKTFLDAGGIPPFALEYPEAIYDQAIIDQMQSMWRQKYGGSKAYGELPIFHGGFKIVKVGDGINDMAWPDLRSITEDKICQAFRVPRELVQTHSSAAGGNGLTTTEQEGAMARCNGTGPRRSGIGSTGH
jgi:HK97 family phage portal protein